MSPGFYILKSLPVVVCCLVSGCAVNKATNFSPSSQSSVIKLTSHQKVLIGNRIWQNECSGSVDGLVSWNEGEDFPSLGIGHFIWYPKGASEPFEESFPQFVAYAKKHSPENLPTWLLVTKDSPWKSRAELHQARFSVEVKGLKRFLSQEVVLQTEFIIQRAKGSFEKLLLRAPSASHVSLRKKYEAVAGTPHGQYALIDYVNFKGEGTKMEERYKNKGWGLLQVLEKMNLREGEPPAHAFSEAAKWVLKRRVSLSPPHRNEERWLKGWINRCESYKKPL